jgi:endogenous inhibitor of DNA gyrase (YacG/DUF329 family)
LARRRQFICVSLAFVPLTALSTSVFGEVTARVLGHDASVVPAIPFLGLWAVVNYRHVKWPCPSCGHPFFFGVFGYSPFADSCRHCGLAKWASPVKAGEQQVAADKARRC